MRRLTLLGDGSPEAAALARWLVGRLPEPPILLDARGPSDAARVARARRRSDGSERIVALAPAPLPGADVAATEAMRSVTGWLADRSPIDRRIEGPEVIAERVAAGAPGAEALTRLLETLAPVRVAKAPKGAGRRGRPRGSDPFRGAGFDVCIALLLERGPFTERALALAAGRSSYGVHRVLVELERRGLLRRARGETTVADPAALLDQLAMAWRKRHRPPRAGALFLSPAPRRRAAVLFAAAKDRGLRCALAGPSAVRGPEAPLGGPLTVYLEGDAVALLRAAGFRPATPGAGDTLVWPVAEAAVFLALRRVGGVLATNRIVTYLDLVAAGDDRLRTVAEALRAEPAP